MTTQQDPILFTSRAAEKVYELISEENNYNLVLRVYISGGGCSGFQYGFTFDETVNPDDMVIVKKISLEKTEKDDDDESGDGSAEVKLVVDAMSFQYLTGAEIDYQEDIHGAQFIIRNPNAKTTCGCGSSFSA